jgi:hypothetical protein
MSALWVKTADLAELLPDESTYALAQETGIQQRQLDKVKNLETFQTSEEFADKLLTALGRPDLYHALAFTDKKSFVHGASGYKHRGCRCNVCKKGKAEQAARAYRRRNGK